MYQIYLEENVFLPFFLNWFEVGMDLTFLLFVLSFEVFFSRAENNWSDEVGLPYPELRADMYSPLCGFLLSKGGALLAFLYGTCLPVTGPSSPALSWVLEVCIQQEQTL